ncbi:hypothetical protein HK105_207958 [Polyrhizophydium stewartii]|uniref:Uncharacterized protein n=1 Tax=Polyrhizophydium stewartii TaxID=2732419 RepID=A0ABR4MZ94_9FUNG|nr:hypothetical protein HK105_000977 [Polyrhizophydium stewartii]
MSTTDSQPASNPANNEALSQLLAQVSQFITAVLPNAEVSSGPGEFKVKLNGSATPSRQPSAGPASEPFVFRFGQAGPAPPVPPVPPVPAMPDFQADAASAKAQSSGKPCRLTVRHVSRSKNTDIVDVFAADTLTVDVDTDKKSVSIVYDQDASTIHIHSV